MIYESTTFLHMLLIYIWNSLLNLVVDVTNVNLLEARLDNILVHPEPKYDFTADLTGTGDRSEYEKNVKHRFYIVCYVDTDKEVFYTCVG